MVEAPDRFVKSPNLRKIAPVTCERIGVAWGKLSCASQLCDGRGHLKIAAVDREKRPVCLREFGSDPQSGLSKAECFVTRAGPHAMRLD